MNTRRSYSISTCICTQLIWEGGMRDLELAFTSQSTKIYTSFSCMIYGILYFFVTKTLFVVHRHKRESHFTGNSRNLNAHYSGKIALFSLTIVQNNDILIFVHIMKDDVIYHM